MIVRAEAIGKIVQRHPVEVEVSDSATPQEIRYKLKREARLLFNEDLCDLEGSDFTITLEDIEEVQETIDGPEDMNRTIIQAGMDLIVTIDAME